MEEKTGKWRLFAAGFVIFLIVGSIFFGGQVNTVTKQPIEFNHKKHIDSGLDCSTCHQFLKDGVFTGIPDINACLTCHEEPITQSPEEQKIREYANKKEDIPWVKITREPGHVYFSHERHVVSGKIECVSCHGKMGERVKPIQKPAIKLNMDMCINCHKKMKVNTDCVVCHK